VEKTHLRPGLRGLVQIREKLVEKGRVSPIEGPFQNVGAVRPLVIIMEKEHQSDGREIGRPDLAPVCDEPTQGLDLLRAQLPCRHRELNRLASPLLIRRLFGTGQEGIRTPLLRRRHDGASRKPHPRHEGNEQGRDQDESPGDFSG